MPAAFIICHYCNKPCHKVRDRKLKLESELGMRNLEKLNHEREKKLCRYHRTNGYSDKKCFQQMEKSEKIKNRRRTKWCSLHSNTSN